uniref:Putative secreted protein n=1 Tax=Anopheles triannulatus TaxID=58253 RepID=A0A2M4B4L2_9DIPT
MWVSCLSAIVLASGALSHILFYDLFTDPRHGLYHHSIGSSSGLLRPFFCWRVREFHLEILARTVGRGLVIFYGAIRWPPRMALGRPFLCQVEAPEVPEY